jgi:catechol O-methyltransferase
MALVALSTLEDLSVALKFLQVVSESDRQIGSLALAGPLSSCERRGLRGTLIEQQFLSVLARCPDIETCVYNDIGLSLATSGITCQAKEVLESSQIAGYFNAWSHRLLQACGGMSANVLSTESASLVKPGTRLAGGERPHEKEIRLLNFVFATSEPGDATGVYQAIETFGRESLSRHHGGSGGRARNAGQWLKVAGGEKSDVLVMSARLAPSKGNFLEVGAYCGYSALRLALATGLRAKILSLEADPAHAVIARNIVAYAGLAHIVDVCVGHSEDWLPYLAQPKPNGAFAFVFFDQRGSRYLNDLYTLERRRALSDGAVIVADNVLKPGAPAFLWHVIFSGLYETQVIAVREFSMPGVEDWMSVSIKRKNAFDNTSVSLAPPLPIELQEMEWEADQMRARAEQSPGVSFEAWNEFVARMRRCLVANGISPRP